MIRWIIRTPLITDFVCVYVQIWCAMLKLANIWVVLGACRTIYHLEPGTQIELFIIGIISKKLTTSATVKQERKLTESISYRHKKK